MSRITPRPTHVAEMLLALTALLLSGCATPDDLGPGAQACLASPEVIEQRHANGAPEYVACANTANLKAMVANPADLEQGRALGPANGERETLAVKAYEQGLTKPLGQTSTLAQSNTTTGTAQ